MGRVVGGGFRIGNSCTPVVDSCQCMTKPIQYCKVKKKKKKKKNAQTTKKNYIFEKLVKKFERIIVQFSSVQLLSHVQLFVTP